LENVFTFMMDQCCAGVLPLERLNAWKTLFTSI
jgi:hypothetical protein